MALKQIAGKSLTEEDNGEKRKQVKSLLCIKSEACSMLHTTVPYRLPGYLTPMPTHMSRGRARDVSEK